MAIFRIRTNTASGTVDVDQIGDLGYPIGGGGDFVDLDDAADVEAAQNSESLRQLLVDDAFGPGDSTLILVEMPSMVDVPQIEALEFLDSWQGESQSVGGGGLTPSQHRGLDQLVHNLAENSYTEPEMDPQGRPIFLRTWTDSGKTTLIRECEIQYTGSLPTTFIERQYDGAGVLTETLTESVVYAGPNPIIPSNISAVLT